MFEDNEVKQKTGKGEIVLSVYCFLLLQSIIQKAERRTAIYIYIS